MKIKNALKWIVCNPMEIISGAALILCILVTVVNALTRYTIRWTWAPTTDVCTLCFGYIVFCGSAAAYKRKMHYGIDIFVTRLPKAGQNIACILAHLFTIFGLVLATWLSVELVQKVGGKILPNTKISYIWFDLSAVLGFGYMAYYEIRQTIDDIKRIVSERKEAAA